MSGALLVVAIVLYVRTRKDCAALLPDECPLDGRGCVLRTGAQSSCCFSDKDGDRRGLCPRVYAAAHVTVQIFWQYHQDIDSINSILGSILIISQRWAIRFYIQIACLGGCLYHRC